MRSSLSAKPGYMRAATRIGRFSLRARADAASHPSAQETSLPHRAASSSSASRSARSAETGTNSSRSQARSKIAACSSASSIGAWSCRMNGVPFSTT
jgi:hypothetical protein